MVCGAVIPWFHDPYLIPKELIFKVGVFAAAAISLWFAPEKRRSESSVSIALCISLFLLGVATSSWNAKKPSVALDAAAVLLGWIVWIQLLRRYIVRPSATRRFILTLLAIGVLQTVLGLVQTHLLFNPGLLFSRANKIAFAGTFGNPDYVASYLAMCLLLCRYTKKTIALPPRLYTAIALALAIGLLLTRCRGPWLALVATVLVMEYKTYPWKKIGAIILSAGVLIAVFFVFRGHLPGMLMSLHTLRGRLLIWACGWHVGWIAKGFGVGLNHFQFYYFDAQKAAFASGRWDAFATNASMVKRGHNEYLDFWIEGGFFLLAAFIGFFWIQFKTIWTTGESEALRPYASILLFAGLVSLVSFPFHIIPNLVLIGFAASRILSFHRPAAPMPIELPSFIPRRVLPVLFMGFAIYPLRAALAQTYFHKAETALKAQRYLTSEEELRKAEMFSPADPDLMLLRARLQFRRFRSQEALTVVEQAETIEKSIDLMKLKGLLFLDLNQWDNAREVYRELATAYPLHITPHFQLGRIYLHQQNKDTAMVEFEKALALEPLSPKARLEQERSKAYVEDLKAGRTSETLTTETFEL